MGAGSPARGSRDRRLVVDQRHGLHPRPSERLRRVGVRARAGVVVVRALPALLQAGGNAAPGRRRIPRRQRSALRHGGRDEEPAVSRVHRGGRTGGLRRDRRHQRLSAGRPGTDGPDDLPRTPLECRDGVPQARAHALQPADRAALLWSLAYCSRASARRASNTCTTGSSSGCTRAAK
jgi:hypothetical protein